MDGLRDDIRNAVHMQRPTSFDEACVLALLQEELLESTRCKEGRRPATFTPNKFAGVRPTVAQTPLTKLHRRLELSVMAMVLKIDLTLFVHITVHVISLFIMEKNGPEITTVLKTFSCMFYKSFGIFVTRCQF